MSHDKYRNMKMPITDVKSELDCGLYTYRIQPIYLKDKNADDIFQKLIQKQSNNEKFTENDYVALLFSIDVWEYEP